MVLYPRKVVYFKYIDLRELSQCATIVSNSLYYHTLRPSHSLKGNSSHSVKLELAIARRVIFVHNCVAADV